VKVRYLIPMIACAVMLVPNTAEARSVSSLVHRAHGNPFKCRIGQSWEVNENKCVVVVVYRHEPRIRQVAMRIINCESQWDEGNVNRDSGASGLAQFLRSTWRMLPRRFSRHSVLNPVWNVRGMRYLRMHDGDFHQWVCR
jgi:hypothetical protein